MTPIKSKSQPHLALSQAVYPPARWVYQQESVDWLRRSPASAQTSVITSLPDWSEISSTYRDLKSWQDWFVSTVATVLGWLPQDGFGIFFQSDIRVDEQWIDKSYLLIRGAEQAGARLIWRKVVCRQPPGTISSGRPSFSHMLCFKSGPLQKITKPGPDVIADGGFKSWPRAMGRTACQVACRFLREQSNTTLVVDPFCGEGATLAEANHWGFHALGIDLSPKRCRIALQQNFQ